MKISCIIPTCDRVEYLIETINSVLAQTFDFHEIIIVNNGKEKLFLPIKIADKVKIFNIIPYIGVAQARNFGASLASGNYLAFLDDDDLWNQNYLRNVSKEISKGAVCIVSRLDKLKNGKISNYKNADKNLTVENILTFNPGITGSNVVISKKIFFQVGGYDTKLSPSEDKSLLFEVLLRKIKVISLPKNQAILRIHDNIRLSTSNNKMAEGIYQFTRKYYSLMGTYQYLFNLLKIYRYRYLTGRKIALLQYCFVKVILIFFRVKQIFTKN